MRQILALLALFLFAACERPAPAGAPVETAVAPETTPEPGPQAGADAAPEQSSEPTVDEMRER